MNTDDQITAKLKPEKIAERFSSWKTILSVVVSLIAVGGSGALYFNTLATKSEVATVAVEIRNAATAAQTSTTIRTEAVERGQEVVIQRLIKVETDQQTMKKQQDRIEDKLDYIILARQPRVSLPDPPAPRDGQ